MPLRNRAGCALAHFSSCSMVTTSSSVTVSNRSLTSGRVSSSTSSTFERSSLKHEGGLAVRFD